MTPYQFVSPRTGDFAANLISIERPPPCEHTTRRAQLENFLDSQPGIGAVYPNQDRKRRCSEGHDRGDCRSRKKRSDPFRDRRFRGGSSQSDRTSGGQPHSGSKIYDRIAVQSAA
jgi:hypothetical protein